MSIDILRIDKLIHRNYLARIQIHSNRYRRKRPKVDASIFRLGAESYSSLGRVGKKEKRIACPLLDVLACGQVSTPRLYRLNFIKYPEFSN